MVHYSSRMANASLVVFVPESTQLEYFAGRKRVTVEDRRFRWDHFRTGMHARGGFDQASLLVRSWSVVDFVCWRGSPGSPGLYMWWSLPGSRRLGRAAILAGVASFTWFAAAL
jgi:hypothetical protein